MKKLSEFACDLPLYILIFAVVIGIVAKIVS